MIITKLEQIAVQNGILFSYGNRANLNLIQSQLDSSKIYLLLDPVTENKTFSEFGGIGSVSYSGLFFLVRQSNYDKTYYNQTPEETFVNNTLSQDLGKYAEYIKPIKEAYLSIFEDEFNCSEYQINSWTITDAVDVFDANMDGVIVNFNISIL